MEIPVQAKEVCSRQIRCMSRKRDAERNESSEACEPCAEKSRYSFICVVPFIGYDSKWPDQSKHRLKKLIQNANDSIVISHSADVSSYKKRNYYMVDHAEYLIGVFDNQKKLRSGTAQTVNYALHQGKVITLIHPDTMEITAPAP